MLEKFLIVPSAHFLLGFFLYLRCFARCCLGWRDVGHSIGSLLVKQLRVRVDFTYIHWHGESVISLVIDGRAAEVSSDVGGVLAAQLFFAIPCFIIRILDLLIELYSRAGGFPGRTLVFRDDEVLGQPWVELVRVGGYVRNPIGQVAT